MFKEDQYNSITFGSLTLDEVRNKVLSFMDEFPDSFYHLVIGTDSQPKNGSGTDFITAIIIHRIGQGGIYFWKRLVDKKIKALRPRIYQEATLSLFCAQEFVEKLKINGISKFDIEIHVDIGNNGQTREMISEIVGMIRGSGFAVKTKPDSFGASKVADRHT